MHIDEWESSSRNVLERVIRNSLFIHMRNESQSLVTFRFRMMRDITLHCTSLLKHGLQPALLEKQLNTIRESSNKLAANKDLWDSTTGGNFCQLNSPGVALIS
mmetsp:Transcript_11823/g.27228  ORF Transcript_11823/g.27228 Transcript_11823/m.27228 type:complete len:103 (-) Transcript_11823:1328-1636(-)